MYNNFIYNIKIVGGRIFRSMIATFGRILYAPASQVSLFFYKNSRLLSQPAIFYVIVQYFRCLS
ncbi:hypothetical protein D0T56_14005 [Dysgonomonas sp. 520]|nr:hypothetical protein [Dysgonomonas sp. 520]